MPLKPPPRNESGKILPHDHDEIHDDDRIIRRISPHHMVRDEKAEGGVRPSTMAFQASRGDGESMSVDIEKLIIEAGLDPGTHIINPPWIGAVSFSAGVLRSKSLMVGYEPVENNPYHGGVWGRFSKGVQNQLLVASTIYVAPIPASM